MHVGVVFQVHEYGMAIPFQLVLYSEPLLHTSTEGKLEFACLCSIVRKQLFQAGLGLVTCLGIMRHCELTDLVFSAAMKMPY